MAIKINYSSYPDRERRSAFTSSLIPESPYPSAGVTVPDCRKIAKSLKNPDIEIRYIEDILIKGIVIFSKKESFSDKIPQIEAFLPNLVSWMVTDIAGPSLYCRKEDRDEAYSYAAMNNSFITSSGYNNKTLSMYGFVITRWNGIFNELTLAGNKEGIAGIYYAW